LIKIGSGRWAVVLTVATFVTISLAWLETRSSLIAAKAAETEETPKEIIADQIRRQGFSCDNALSAERDRERSKPDQAVWILKCDKATYRVRLIPDMAAVVERID
jgi:hypothetical protein